MLSTKIEIQRFLIKCTNKLHKSLKKHIEKSITLLNPMKLSCLVKSSYEGFSCKEIVNIGINVDSIARQRWDCLYRSSCHI